MARVRDTMRKLEAGEAIVAGVLSGTSADGIDVVLARPRVSSARVVGLESLHFETLSFEPELGRRVRAALAGGALDVRGVALLSRDLGRAFGEAAASLARRRGLDIDLVGSHGQTLWHHDEREPSGPASLQLGDGDWVAEAAGAMVVSDFRQRDLAAGGSGAPLSVLADDVLFAQAPRPATILNLGGLANLSWLGAEGELSAFDTGPAGALLDGLARRLLERSHDEGGAVALGGAVAPDLLAAWLEHPFFQVAPPKSTGRDTFGEAWLDGLLQAEVGRRPEDLLATGCALVAESVARATRAWLPVDPARLYVAGGGVHNMRLMGELTARVGAEAVSTEDVGVDPDAREALVFAALAARCLLGESVTRAEATGAVPGRPLGKISPLAR